MRIFHTVVTRRRSRRAAIPSAIHLRALIALARAPHSSRVMLRLRLVSSAPDVLSRYGVLLIIGLC